jgi:ABC-type multidrug transport system fused ATPase/permease subunit
MLLLFRIFEPATGVVEIDGVDIRRLGLHNLRKHLSIIPQEPLLLAGSIRYNLDPFNECTTEALTSALLRVGLGEVRRCTHRYTPLIHSSHR